MDKMDILLKTSDGNPPKGCEAYDYESGKCKDTNKPCDMCYENTKNLIELVFYRCYLLETIHI